MDLSVVVATLNARDRLETCLDSLAAHASEGEVIVVNGPSTDGTTGMVRGRDDVAVLVEIADRNCNAARNAGFQASTGDAVAFLADEVVVEPGWYDAVMAALSDGADVVSGPVRSRPESTTEPRNSAGSLVDCSDGPALAAENLVLTRDAVVELDGFDEYLEVADASDVAHRAAALGLRTTCEPNAAVQREPGAVRADGFGDVDWGSTYRSYSYRLAKNLGPRPEVAGRTLRQALSDGLSTFGDVLDGSFPPSRWLGDGRTVASNCLRGFGDGLLARYRSDAERNPNGVSSRLDRAVQTYDWR